jgi:hypothetical protein
MSRGKKRPPKTYSAARSRVMNAAYSKGEENFDREIAHLKKNGAWSPDEDEESILREGYVLGFRTGAMMAIGIVDTLFKSEFEEAHARRVAIGKANAERQRQQVRDKLAAHDAREGGVS